MSVEGLPTLSSTRLLQTLITDTKTRLQDARTEAVTGRVASVADATDGDVAKVQRLEKLIDDANAYELTISFTRSELDSAQSVLTNFASGVTELGVALQGAVETEDQLGIDARAIDARGRLQSAIASLNTSVGGRYLFSGAAIDARPLADAATLLTRVETIITAAPDAATAIADLDAYFADTPGSDYELEMYQGSTIAAPGREVAEGQRVSIETDARDPAIKELLRGLALAAVADDAIADPDMRDALLLDAAQSLADGANAVIAVQGEIGARQEQLQTLEAANSAMRLTYELGLNALTAVDEAEAATVMRELELQLEASFLTAARIVQLSLVNFLR